ncbi:MAG: c-type cytochrome [Gammaproteobacteria bacterium]|nr:c-type cytochrome [Gammaproteobacteria bacterium]
MVRLGKEIFVNTHAQAAKYVGNGLNCSNCHLDSGRHAHSAPLWAAYVSYPAYRKKTQRVDTYEERIQGCFRYSMNGVAPPSGSRELTALVSYSYWLASGAPVGVKLAGAGYPELPKPTNAPDINRGAKVYAENCVLCHGANGEGTKAEGRYAFPPLWGADSFNWGAGMHRINTAAGFIKGNMPLAKPNSLSDQDAWDVAAFVVSHERPADPRFTTSLAVTKKKYHDEMCYYGEQVNGHAVGASLQATAK